MGSRNGPFSHTLLVIHVLLVVTTVFSDSTESEKLVTFKRSLLKAEALSNWITSAAPCNGDKENWRGVICGKDGSVFGLRLENMALSGTIDMDMLAELPGIRTLSFINNSFEGPMPDVQKIRLLRSIFLSNNNFSGVIRDDAFAGMSSMRKVELQNNKFTGRIPRSLSEMKILVDLQMQDNEFEGEIPDFEQKNLKVNFANNRLYGPIPPGLRNQDPSSFAVVFVISPLIFRARTTAKNGYKYQQTTKLDKNNDYKTNTKDIEMPSYEEESYKRTPNGGKLQFVRNDITEFKLHDLLRASAEVLGGGSFGSSYKATLANGPAVVVKRFREMSNVKKEEFYSHANRLGSFSHPNLLPLVAFYHKKDEKLLITDFAQNGSLASHLHGKRKPNEPGLDWRTRLSIIKGVAQGLDYLYKELPHLVLPHGHLKSSNVLLNDAFIPLLADYGLIPLVNKRHAQKFMVAYKSPEFTYHDSTTTKTDVWCLGILILEILTGKFPANYLKQGKGGSSDLETWVNSVVREEWTGEVFDKEMKGTKNSEGEMLKLLKIGMCCCEWNIERRWDLKAAVEKIGELKERGSDEDYSSCTSDGAYSSRAMTDEDFSFSVTG
ncbi:Leucine-rich repeat-containing N-terminal, type 2 [Cynara cardunculus var. scolymus]|uniref:Leucine-rich repeat-containing N-terminal, type 2 n=1 Tax=Cynara cardunculus var. scolymus TaxID=59895 RepID=A0A118JTN0_CYNCS|nr:Leucine-rich repeat-containing N-terminal, type 2 [Cynara cardunculus var. scolymus]